MTAPPALSEALGFTVACAFIAAIGLIIWASQRWAKRNATTDTRPASCPSTGAGRGHTPCARMDCDEPATNAVHASGEFWWFCKPHALPYLTAPYDQEADISDRQIREVMEDARRITREAAGGVA